LTLIGGEGLNGTSIGRAAQGFTTKQGCSFTTGLTIMGLHFQERHCNDLLYKLECFIIIGISNPEENHISIPEKLP